MAQEGIGFRKGHAKLVRPSNRSAQFPRPPSSGDNTIRSRQKERSWLSQGVIAVVAGRGATQPHECRYSSRRDAFLTTRPRPWLPSDVGHHDTTASVQMSAKLNLYDSRPDQKTGQL